VTSSLFPRRLLAVVRRYENSSLIEEHAEPLSLRETAFDFAGAKWRLMVEGDPAVELVLKLVVESGAAANVALALDLELPWSRQHYLLMPGVVYAGNRFACRPYSYPPMLTDPEDLGLNKGPFISDIPRLNDGEGDSQIQLLAGGMASAHVGIFDPNLKRGLLVLTDPFSNGRESGFTIRESSDRREAVLSLSTPGVRVGTRYVCCTTRVASRDRGVDLKSGESLSLRVRLDEFPCDAVPDLFTHLLDSRTALTGEPEQRDELPFSAAWEILEAKYNRDNWNPAGYYRVGMGENRHQDFQVGWVGGLMSTLPLLHEGDETSRQRALDTLDLVLVRGGSAPSGFFYGIHHRGVWSGDGFEIDRRTPRERPHPERDHYHLLRKSADALYFILRQFDLLTRQQKGWTPPEAWTGSVRKCADAFVRMWRRYGQLGQFVDVRNGDMIIGGSSSAGIAPAGLALAARFFQQPDYLVVAEEVADYFYSHSTREGLSNGGPAEALQCPDSESSAGLLESYVVLWEKTGNSRWLAVAEEAAAQFASWQMPYDYTFPPQSEFGRLGLRSAGAVFANAQNGHGAPGICTLSGNSLFKLYRATGKAIYLQLMRDLAHGLPQYLSREDRPIRAKEGKPLPPGWMNERVNTSDWDENLGGVFCGSTWAEVSLMLTVMDIPGLYIREDLGQVVAFDHVRAEPVMQAGSFPGVRVLNPTRFACTVKVLRENAERSAQPLEENYLLCAESLYLGPGKEVILSRNEKSFS
jgi:hypothetical protein